MAEEATLTIQEKVQKLSLVFQPIWEITDGKPELICYETLLRYGDGEWFPIQVFKELTQTQEHCLLLNNWFQENLTRYLEAYPEVRFSVNIDLQQMKHESTKELLLALSPYKDRLLLELTEFYELSNLAHKELFYDSMAYIRDLGMRLAFDDVGNGQHSVSFVTQNIDLVDSIKISLLHLKHLDSETVGMIIDTWVRIASLYQVTLVVEGIDSEELAKDMAERGVIYHQGFYYCKAIRLSL